MSHFTGADLSSMFLQAFQSYNEGNYEEAVRCQKEIYEAAAEYYGSLHAQTISALNNLVIFARSAGKEEEASAYAKLAYEKSLEAYGEADERTRRAKQML